MFKNRTFEPNPIIIKELRSRMRGPRPFITLTGMLILLSGITYVGYRLSQSYYNYYTGVTLSAQIGQTLFTMLVFLLLLFILIITPAVTANSVSQEKENLTYEILMTTPLHPARILWGKLFSAMSYVFLLIFAAIPVASLIFVFGGVSMRDMVKSIIILIAIAVSIGVFGLLMSTILKRSARATVISYVVIAIFIIGTILIFGAIGVITNEEPPRWVLVMNPISVLASGLSNVNYNNYGRGLMPLLAADFNTLNGGTIAFDYIPRPLYHYSLPLMGLASLFMYGLATRFLLPTRRWQVTTKDFLVFLVIFISLIVITAGGFMMTIDQYERAIVPDNRIIDTLINPISSVRPMVEPQVAVEVAVEEVQFLDISDADLVDILPLAIFEVRSFWEKTTQTEIQMVNLVTTTAISPEESSDYAIPGEFLVGAIDQLEMSKIKTNVISTLDEASDFPEEILTLVFSNITPLEDGTASSTIYCYQFGELACEYNYTYSYDGANWFIIDSDMTFYQE